MFEDDDEQPDDNQETSDQDQQPQQVASADEDQYVTDPAALQHLGTPQQPTQDDSQYVTDPETLKALGTPDDGYVTDPETLKALGTPDQPEAEGALGTFLRSAGHGVLPAIGAATGGELGAGAGAIVGGLPGAIIGGLGGAVIGGYATATGQSAAAKAAGFDDDTLMAADIAAHPWAAAAGSAISNLAGFGTGAAGGAIGTAGRVVSGAISGGGEAATQYAQGSSLSEAIPPVVGATVAGAVAPQPRRLAQAAGVVGEDIGRGFGGRYPSLRNPVPEAGMPQGAPTETAAPATPETLPTVSWVTPKDPAEAAPPKGVDTPGGLGAAMEATAPPAGTEPRNDTHNAKNATPASEAAADSGMNVQKVGQIEPTLDSVINPPEASAPEPEIDAAVSRAMAPEPPATAAAAARPPDTVSQAPVVPPRTAAAIATGKRLAAPAPTEDLNTIPDFLKRTAARRSAVEQAAQQHGGLEPATAALQQRIGRQVGDIQAGRVQPDPAQMDRVQRLAITRRDLEARRAAAATPPEQSPPTPPDDRPLMKPSALGKATEMHDELDRLRRNRDADLPDLENDVKAAQKTAGMPAPAFRNAGRNVASELEMYRAVEDQDRSHLTPQQQAYMAEIDKRWNAEATQLRQRLGELGVARESPTLPNFIRRLVKGYQGDVSDMVNDDPTTGTYRGGRPSTLQDRVFHGMTAEDGEHHVISRSSDGTLNVFRKGQLPIKIPEHPSEENLGKLYGEKLNFGGKEFTIGDTRARDIADRVPDMQYHESYTTAKASELMQLREATRQAELFNDFKTNNARWGDVRSATPKPGWVRSEVPGLSHLYMDPTMAQAFDRVYKMDPWGNTWLRKINDIAISSIFLNPVPHSLNEAYHWVVGRGEDWLKPSGYYNLFKSGSDAITAVLSKNQDYVDSLRARAPMVNAGRARQDAMFRIANLAGADMKRAPHEWDIIAKKFGIGPSQLFREIYNASASAMWTVGDVLRLQRMYELRMQGMTPEQSLTEMIRHQPDYRLPLQVFGSSKAADFLANNRYALMFTRYHYRVFASLADMAKNAISPSASMEERRKAFGHLMMLGLLAFVGKPLLDDLAKKVTGNKNAEVRPRGPLAPLYAGYDVATGKKDLGQAISGGFTMAPAARLGLDVMTNRDWAGRQIVNPQAPAYKQVGQGVEHLAGSLVSPYSTIGPTLMPGSSKGTLGQELRNQLLDIKAPTAAQVKGAQSGQQRGVKEQQTRDRKPRGLIEYGVGRAGQAIRPYLPKIPGMQ